MGSWYGIASSVRRPKSNCWRSTLENIGGLAS
jgi:hypothetical protein